MLVLVSATRLSLEAFHRESLLGRCLPRLGTLASFGLKLAHGNCEPLAKMYNAAIEEAAPDDVLVFVHDDVHVDDWLLAQRLDEALKVFDVVGVAGSKRVVPGQLAWHQKPVAPGRQEHAWDPENLSGAICHGETAGTGALSVYGPSPQAVRLLDGVFLAARAGRLQQAGVRFDPAMAFHFYDLDFCLSAARAGLKLGTWPIALTHRSGGDSIHSDAWHRTRPWFEKKWYS